MERQSQTRINLKEWTIISWVIWGGEKPGRPPAELNQGPPTLSLRQDKKERTSHRTAAPTWASSRPRNSRAEGRASYVPSGGPGLVLPFGSTSGQRLNSQIAPFSPCVREIAKYSDIFGSTPALSVPTRLAAVISAEAPRPSRTELVGMGETRVRMCATPPPPFYEHLYTPRVGRFLHWKRPPEMTWLRAGTVSDDLGDSVSS